MPGFVDRVTEERPDAPARFFDAAVRGRPAGRRNGRERYRADEYRSATLPQFTTFHHAFRYSGRRFWYLR